MGFFRDFATGRWELADKTLLEQLEEQMAVLEISIHQKEGAKKVYSDLLKNIKED